MDGKMNFQSQVWSLKYFICKILFLLINEYIFCCCIFTFNFILLNVENIYFIVKFKQQLSWRNIMLNVIYVCIGWNPKVSFPKPQRMPSVPQRPRIPAPKPPAPPSAPCEHKGPPSKMRGFFGWQQQRRIKVGKENWINVTIRKITTSLCFMFSKFDLTIDYKYLDF